MTELLMPIKDEDLWGVPPEDLPRRPAHEDCPARLEDGGCPEDCPFIRECSELLYEMSKSGDHRCDGCEN